ncbi:cytochrome c oxidase subunit 4 isoform 1, mitochondrial [Phlebotomus argentipes]|uniref:cytochrome c oxidase subunit 4 isoform 1, mitochondrial n=1 Tax=Phlebotomus argentipes TaxID=94469 RepID=UPI0028937928|nr:cytochrome c oxidase subunit 4 isoform 1, mitochondrial [Phlebotomus argentipes]
MMSNQFLSVARNAVLRQMVRHSSRDHSNFSKIGKREVVGYGRSGEPVYYDCVEYPMPAIRWQEPTPQLLALREKEKGDWKKLSIDEKKALYRASFCQTFAEFKHPTGEWKGCIGWTLVFTSIAIVFSLWMNAYVYDELPESFSEESRKAQLKRMLDLEVNPIHGLSSKWDYENKRWK